LRKLILGAVVAAAAIAAPAAAQPYDAHPYQDPRDEGRDEALVRDIPSPGEVEAIGDTLARATDALLDVQVGPLREAIEPGRRMSRREREETLGDLASRDDPYARERLHDEIRHTSAGLAVATRRIAILAPQLRRTLEQATRQFEDAIDEPMDPRDPREPR